MDDKITIDKETLKAIASDTRLDILKQLDKKKQTLSELSKSLKLSSPTVKEHLEVLGKAGLINKENSQRKWKYYSLTFKGKQLLRPNETKLFLALVISIVVGLGIFIFLGLFGSLGSNAINKDSSNLNETMLTTSIAEKSEPLTTVSVGAEYTRALTDNSQEVTTSKESTKNSFFNKDYFIFTFVVLIISIILILYLKEKYKHK